MPMEDTLHRLLLPNTVRDVNSTANYLVSSVMPAIIAVLLLPSGNSLLWASYLSILVFIDWLLLRHIPVLLVFPARIITFLITLPAYILLLPAELSNRLYLMASLLPSGNFPLINDDAIYLFTTNAPLLFVSIICCISAVNALDRLVEKQFPQLWWITSTVSHAVLFVLTISFLLWNVR